MGKFKTLLSVILIFTIISCQESDDLNLNGITGTYTGTLTSNLSNKSNSSKATNTATSIVRMVGEQIEVHCFGDDFDETVMLDIYHDNDRVLVCLTGNEFENMYGHMLGQGNMGGNMHNNTEWGNHLNNEHQEGDEHFGNFDMQHHLFNYTFKMNNGDFHFQGTKE